MAGSKIKKFKYSRQHPSPVSRKTSTSSVVLGHRNYARYINRVLREVVPQSGISSRTLDIMNTLINDIFELIAMQACNLMYLGNRCTLTPEDIQKAVYSLLPKKLAKLAVAFGNQAVQRYAGS
uniref:Core Histone H2A/H2B/H3 domain-containing protein n=1 Tax=Otolemur garnettii TaxID=30611 RepID=H0XLJ0_OTOGA